MTPEVIGVIVALSTLAFSALSGVAVMIYKFASLVTKVNEAIKTLSKDLATMSPAIEALKEIPVIQNRLKTYENLYETLSDGYKRMRSDISELTSRVAWTRGRLDSFDDILEDTKPGKRQP